MDKISSTDLSDVLSHDFTVVRSVIVQLELGPSTTVAVPEVRQPVLHLVLQGAVRVALAKADPPILLSAGDSALVLYGDAHLVGEGAPLTRAMPVILPQGVADEPARVRVGADPAAAILMSCVLELAYLSPAARSIRAAPKIWPMRGGGMEGGTRIELDVGQVSQVLVGAGASAFGSMLANLLLLHGMREMRQARWAGTPIEIRAPGVRSLAAAIQAIHVQPDRPWTVARLAHEVGLSRSSFAADFHDHVGASPIAYLTGIRMARAAQLLSSGALSVAEVARRVGYHVPASFARAFAAVHGVSPTVFQTRHRDAGRHQT